MTVAVEECACVCSASALFMDTLVAIDIVHGTRCDDCVPAVERAFDRFREVEERCSRFDRESELSRLSATCGTAVRVSPMVFDALAFALEVAADTGGAFDPTMGRTMERSGFSENYRTGEHITRTEELPCGGTYRDVNLDPANRSVTLRVPMVLDLGAVAKGLAVDLAARELLEYPGFAIDAGGDLYLHGVNATGAPWVVGVRHPRNPAATIAALRVSEAAVCTSGDYERPRRDGGDGHHIIQRSSCRSEPRVISVTVVAPTAMAADALSTAAFVLGPHDGIDLLRAHGAEGLIISDGMELVATAGWPRSE